MSALKSQKPAVKRMSMREMIAFHQEVVGIKSADLAAALGYSNANVVSMLRAGTMTLPNNKISRLASALHLDPLHVAITLNEENGFNLGAILEAVSKRTAVTLNEEKLILAMREAAAGNDINFDKQPQLLAKLMDTHLEIVKAETDLSDETLAQLRTKKRSAVAQPDPAPRRKKKSSDAADQEPQ